VLLEGGAGNRATRRIVGFFIIMSELDDDTVSLPEIVFTGVQWPSS
jgi:hypothetical protein